MTIMFGDLTFPRQLVYFFCLFTLSVINCGPDVTLKEIYKESERVMDNSSVERHMEVVAKYYFTQEKEKSVWYVAQQAARDLFNIDLGKDDLYFIEKLLVAVGHRYDECLTFNPGKSRAQCFYHLASLVVDLEKGARWITAPDISQLNKAKFGTLYNSVATLIAHLSLIAQENIRQFNNTGLITFKMHGYRKAIENTLRTLYDYDIDVIQSRADAISAAIICEINARFWKEFVGSCETRWRRSIDSEDKLPTGELLKGNQTDENDSATVGDDEFDVVSLEDEYKLLEQDSILHAADKIGNSWGTTQKKFRVQILDDVSKRVVFEEYMFADLSSRNAVVKLLAQRAQKGRDEVARKRRKKITAFINDTFIVNWKLLKTTLDRIQK